MYKPSLMQKAAQIGWAHAGAETLLRLPHLQGPGAVFFGVFWRTPKWLVLGFMVL